MPKSQASMIVELSKDVEYIKQAIDGLNVKLSEHIKCADERYVSQASFTPVKLITYGLAGGTLTWALGNVLEIIPKLAFFISFYA